MRPAAVVEREGDRRVGVALPAGLARLDREHRAVVGLVLLGDLDRAGERHRHRAHLDQDLGLHGVRARRLDHAAALDGRHDALEVGDGGEALVDRLRRRERVVQLYGHGRSPVRRCGWVGGCGV